MGLSFSCSDYECDFLDENFDGLILRSISFKDDGTETAVRSVSFNCRDSEPTILKPFGCGKMVIEGSLSFKGRERDPFHLETTISIKSPRLDYVEGGSFNDLQVESPRPSANVSIQRAPCSPTAGPSSPKHEAAVKLQKVYKSFRTRRQLADCAVLVEQKWSKLLDFVVLKRSSVSFFDIGRPESAVSRWSRARTRAAKVGKGLSKDEKARKLALQHWLEAIDPRHRYGHNLHFYYDRWLSCESAQPFFYWLDVGEGRDCNLEGCPRAKLQQQCIKYLDPKEREAYEVIVEDGKLLFKQPRELLDTTEAPKNTKWIFVLSTCKALYVGQKKKGTFQHSSFLAGGATSAAGRLIVEKGVLKAIWPHSGHYKPTEENFQEFKSFLRERNVDLTDVKNTPPPEEEMSRRTDDGSHMGSLRRDPTEHGFTQMETTLADDKSGCKEHQSSLKPSKAQQKQSVSISIPKRTDLIQTLQSEAQSRVTQADGASGRSSPTEEFVTPKWDLLGEDPEVEKAVPEESIFRRINSKKGMKSYQLGKQLSCKWTTGAGPRIGCVRDYPTQLQISALEQMSLSPKSHGHSRAFCSPHSLGHPSSRSLAPGHSRACSSPLPGASQSPLSISSDRKACNT